MRNRIAFGVFFASAAVLSARCNAEDFFLHSRAPTTQLFLYSGLDWSKPGNGAVSALSIPIEARLVTPCDYGITLQTSAVHDDLRETPSLETGDTTISMLKGWRPKSGFEYISVEGGYRFEHSIAQPPNEDAIFGRVRVKWGPTRMGFDASTTWFRAAEGHSDDAALAYSFGYRGQFQRAHIGVDLVLVDYQDAAQESLRYINAGFMQRRLNGDAFYGSVQTRLSRELDDWYVSVGYEWRFELDGHRIHRQ